MLTGSAYCWRFGETHLEEATFPSECPYTTEQIVSDDYWPE